MISLLTVFNSRFSLLRLKFELWGLKILVLLLFRSVLGFRWPLKVVISSGTFYKNRFFKQFTFTASSKLLLAPFLTLLASLMTPKRESQGGPRTIVSAYPRLFGFSGTQLHYLKRNFGPKIHRFCCKTIPKTRRLLLQRRLPDMTIDAFWRSSESCRCPVRNWKTHRRNKQSFLFVLKLCTCKFVHTQYG